MKKSTQLTLLAGLTALSCLPSLANAQVSYKQTDSAWSAQKLGFSTKDTIGGYGCLITSVADWMQTNGMGANPSTVNNRLKEMNGFSGSLMKWDVAARLMGYRQSATYNYQNVPANVDTICNLINSRDGSRFRPVILETRSSGMMHFVWAYGWTLQGGLKKIQICDPLTGQRHSFESRYGSQTRNIYRAVTFTP